MKHITQMYGSKCNLLELTVEEYKELDAFLMNLGVRSRMTILDWVNDTMVIQAENPFREMLLLFSNRSAEEALVAAEEDMSEKNVALYKA